MKLFMIRKIGKGRTKIAIWKINVGMGKRIYVWKNKIGMGKLRPGLENEDRDGKMKTGTGK